jgi:hypothetical protein
LLVFLSVHDLYSEARRAFQKALSDFARSGMQAVKSPSFAKETLESLFIAVATSRSVSSGFSLH